MKLAVIAAAFVACTSLGAAIAQQPATPPIVKPKPPTKPTPPKAPDNKPSAALPAQKLPPDLEVPLTPKAQKLAILPQLKTFTPATRSQTASRLMKEPVTIATNTATTAIGPWSPIAPTAWLSMQGGLWRTGPQAQAMIFLPNVTVNPQANITLKFTAAPGVRYMLVCDLSAPEVWDVVFDGRATPLTTESDILGATLIPPLAPGGLRTLKLVVQRLSTPTAPMQNEALRRCEITAIRA